jgi:membrane protein implicated in regulation of membrane protease activity
VFLIVAFVLLFVLPTPWNVVGFAVSLVGFLGELSLWYRTVRHRRVEVGAETLIGQTATVVSACRPDGQVRLLREIWKAHCEDGADPGEEVVVVARKRLTLVVERAGSSPGTTT